MRTLSLHPHRDDILAARTEQEAKPLPAPTAPKPLGWGPAMLAYLRAEDAPVVPRQLPPRALPSRDLIERCAAVSTALHADYERHLDTMRVLDGILATAPAVLAAGTALSADLLGLALAELSELLDMPLPGSDWAANLRTVLPAAVPPTSSFVAGARVVHNASGAAGTIDKIALGRAVVRLDRMPEGLTPFSFYDLSLESGAL